MMCKSNFCYQGGVFVKWIVTLEVAGYIEEHKNFEACDKNINPLGSELKVDNVFRIYWSPKSC